MSTTRRPSARTTRTATLRAPRREPQLLAPMQVIASPETRARYCVDHLLGAGGFGQVYLAKRLGRSRKLPQVLCIKISRRIDAWLREAYFAQLLEGHPRAIRIYDAFPLLQSDGRDVQALYCLALEYARNGDLSSYLAATGKGWPETTARREIAGILEVLRKLHRGQMLHRDLTPLNVFVCERRKLKLGDFGIARPQSDRRGVSARTMNVMTAPMELLAGAAPKWQARDDVYQVGQLLGMLIRGDARRRIPLPQIKTLECSDQLKEIIYRCIGERRKRYESADELIEALKTRPTRLRAGSVRSLKGKHVAFTGILSKPRRDAIAAARRAGAIVQSGPSSKTDVIVRGRPNAQQAAGKDGGLKLMEIKRLREKGQRITILNEDRFWLLAGARKGAARSRSRRKK